MSEREKGTAQPVEGRCGARLRGTDPPRYCGLAPLKGRTRCKLHGGKSKRGVESGTFKTGERSRFVPQRYLADAERAMADPDVMSVRFDFALAEARNAELLRSIDAASSIEAWLQARGAADRVKAALGKSPAPKVKAALDRLLEVVSGGTSAANAERSAWKELRNNMRVRARLVEVERRRLEAMGATMSAEQALALAARLAAIVNEHVQDPAVRQRIADEILAAGASSAPAAASTDEPGPHGAF